ncbi:MAG: T9SS type A sorting domain-containing protein [Flavobacteriales bacterium]|nr:T9SS type A sorting domain-containing protein [Flavobacteriales bacterium]
MLSTDNEIISTLNPEGFGTSAEVYFQSGGTFDLEGNFKSRVLQFESGEFYSNGYDVWVDFNLYFSGQDDKNFDIQNSTCYFRGLQWNDNQGDNLFFDNTGGLIQWSGTLSPGNFNDQLNIVHIFNDLLCESEGFLDQAQVNTNIEVNTLTIAPGKTLQFWLSTQVTVNQLICEGTADDPITFRGSSEGTQCFIEQNSGEVFGEYLMLLDIAAIGDATFYANNSQDLGNVNGWIFTGQVQTITYDSQDAVMEDVGTVNLNAEASSGLAVTYEVVSGPAFATDNVITVTGPGLIVVEVNQAGDDLYNPAPTATIEFCSNPLQPTITTTTQPGSVLLTSSSTQGNQWFDEDGILVGADDQTYESFVTGTFTVQVDIDGCVSEMSETASIIVDSVNEQENIVTSVYPNPANEDLNVLLSRWASNLSIELWTLDGRQVLLEELTGAQLRIDVSSLTAGTYVLKINGENINSNQLLVIE